MPYSFLGATDCGLCRNGKYIIKLSEAQFLSFVNVTCVLWQHPDHRVRTRPSFPIWSRSSADCFPRNCPYSQKLPGQGADTKFRPLWLNSNLISLQIWSSRLGQKRFLLQMPSSSTFTLPVLLHSSSVTSPSHTVSWPILPETLQLPYNNAYLLTAYSDVLNIQCV